MYSNSHNKINEDTELPQNARIETINASKRAKQIRVKSLVSKNKDFAGSRKLRYALALAALLGDLLRLERFNDGDLLLLLL